VGDRRRQAVPSPGASDHRSAGRASHRPANRGLLREGQRALSDTDDAVWRVGVFAVAGGGDAAARRGIRIHCPDSVIQHNRKAPQKWDESCRYGQGAKNRYSLISSHRRNSQPLFATDFGDILEAQVVDFHFNGTLASRLIAHQRPNPFFCLPNRVLASKLATKPPIQGAFKRESPQ